MSVEQQYIDLFSQTETMICRHSAEVLNAPRAAAFADFERLGFPTRKQEKYKYTDVSKFFEPDYGLNLNRLEIPVNPYEVFKCDVPNMSTALYFVVNDAFYDKALPKSHLPEGVIFGSLKEVAEQNPELVKKYYGKLADTAEDGVTAFNTAFAHTPVLNYVFSGLFYLLLLLAALTSSISMNEIATAFIHENYHVSRHCSTIIVTSVAIVLGTACSLSFGAWADVKLFGMGFFDLFDFITAKFMMPLGGILITVFVGWYLDRKLALSELTNEGTCWCRAARVMLFLIRWVAPVGVGAVFLNQLMA